MSNNNYSFNPLQMSVKFFFDKAVAEDELFAGIVKEKGDKKTIAECSDYILGEAYHYANEHKHDNFAFAGCPDEQIVSMIRHYWTEDNIEIRKVDEHVKPVVSAPKGKTSPDFLANASKNAVKPTSPSIPMSYSTAVKMTKQEEKKKADEAMLSLFDF